VNHFFHTLALTGLLAGAPLAATAAPVAAAQAAPAAAATDDLAAKVKSQIDANADLKGSDVAVTAEGGVVTLKGVVASPLVRAKIGEVTKSIAGVTKVNNKLTLAKK
jgi:osmotically-inducible protein OsmY